MQHHHSTPVCTLLNRLWAVFLLLGAIALPISTHAQTSTGVTADEIVIGMSNAQTGPAQALGQDLKAGAEVYFNKVNAAGGIYGRKIRLISYDDGYEPVHTIENTINLIRRDHAFLLFGYVGTPTSEVAVPIATRSKTPYFAPFTGAEFLRNPVNPYVFNIRASYFDETSALVQHLIEDLNIKSIGMFIQNDGYGAAGRAGVQNALEAHGLSIAVVGKYERNTTDVSPALEQILKIKPEAVILIGAYQPCAAFIKAARAQHYNPVFMNISFVGTNAFLHEVGQDGENTFISQVVPHPQTSPLPLVEAYHQDMTAANQESMIGFGSLEGYLDAKTLVEALKRTGENLTRENFLATLESLSFDAGGLSITFSPESHQGQSNVYLTRIHNGQVQQIQRLNDTQP